jgi:hypothetical protein
MQRPLSFVLGFCLFAALAMTSCVSSYNRKSPEQLGKTVFKIIQKQDDAGLGKVIPSQADLELFLSTSDMPEEEVAGFRAEMAAILAEFEEEAAKSYQTFINTASREGVVLSKAKIGTITATTRQGIDNMIGEVKVPFTYGGKLYTLILPDVGKVASGWAIGLDGFHLQTP